MKFDYFASCPRGLEKILSDELKKIKAVSMIEVDGGVSFSGSLETMYRANLESRIATRILFRLKKGGYESEEDLYNFALSIKWASLFDVSKSIKLSTTGVKCPLKSIDFMTLRIKDAVCDQFRKEVDSRPDVDIREPNVRIHLYLEKNEYQIYLDTSGKPLYQRGFRKESVLAPLRENLAAGIISLSGWTPGNALLDPMCGSGTFLIEAAMIAQNQIPGLKRGFGFEHWKNFDSNLLSKLKAEYKAKIKPISFAKIYGSDIDLRSIRVAKTNLEKAGLAEVVQLSCKNFTEIEPPLSEKENILITNPPYGERIGEDSELNSAYPIWATILKQKFAGWRTYFLTNDLRMPKLMRLAPSKKTPLYNGALECRLFEIMMVKGSNRK